MVKANAPRYSSTAPRAKTSQREGYWTGAHTKHRLRVHLVWIPKYRKRVLEIANVFSKGRWLPVLMSCYMKPQRSTDGAFMNLPSSLIMFTPDHVHLLLQIPPTASISSVAKSLKGGTSRVLRAEFPELEEFLWGTSFWAQGYFAESVGQVEEAVVSAYIRHQNTE